jgi:hypothetical protein
MRVAANAPRSTPLNAFGNANNHINCYEILEVYASIVSFVTIFISARIRLQAGKDACPARQYK